MRRNYLILFLLLTAIPGHSQRTFRFAPVPEATVWGRVERFAKKNAEREQRMKEFFREAGCDAKNLSELRVRGSKLPDIVCILTGETSRVIVVGAHFDKVDPGDGIVDNWSGAAMLPSLLQALSAERRTHTFVFIGFTDEEKGLVGSSGYLKEISKDEQQRISAMVNLDTLGLGPSEVWASVADKGLLRALAVVAQSMNLPISGMNVDKVGSADSEAFRAKKIPALTIHSVTTQTLPILHTSKDTVTAMHRTDYAQTFRLMCGYLAYLDIDLDQASDAGVNSK